MEERFIELRIDELIKEKKISWAELSRRSGISKGKLSEIKNGQIRLLNHDYEVRLAKALDCETKDLYTSKVKWRLYTLFFCFS